MGSDSGILAKAIRVLYKPKDRRVTPMQKVRSQSSMRVITSTCCSSPFEGRLTRVLISLFKALMRT